MRHYVFRSYYVSVSLSTIVGREAVYIPVVLPSSVRRLTLASRDAISLHMPLSGGIFKATPTIVEEAFIFYGFTSDFDITLF